MKNDNDEFIAQITSIKQALGEFREKAREDNEVKRDIFDTLESNFTSLWIAGACLTISFYTAAIGLMIAGIYWLVNNI